MSVLEEMIVRKYLLEKELKEVKDYIKTLTEKDAEQIEMTFGVKKKQVAA